MKRCRRCNKLKTLDDFSKHLGAKSSKSGLRSNCKSCAAKYYRDNKGTDKAWRAKNADKLKEYAKWYHILKTYGLTKEQYKLLELKQNGKCNICKTRPLAVVDHDHSTGKTRSLLCYSCNTALGLVLENVHIIEQLGIYIKENNCVN